MRTRYATHHALSELPYFRLRDNRVLETTEDFGPIADVHTHLALSYIRKPAFDLSSGDGHPQHYLPMEAPLELDVYANLNFDKEHLTTMKRDLTVGSLRSGGMRSTHTVPNLEFEMAALGITRSILLPIDMPFGSNNAERYLGLAADDPRLVSLGSVHPFAANRRKQLENQKRAGAPGIKVHPSVQAVAPDHPRAMSLYAMCADLELSVLWHCGPVGIEPKFSRRLCQLPRYRTAVMANPRTTFILGHSGALQMESALDLCCTFDNVYLEISSQSLTNVRTILTKAPADRVMFGSDWPFYHQAMPLAKALIATEDRRELRRPLFWDNAARLFGLGAR